MYKKIEENSEKEKHNLFEVVKFFGGLFVGILIYHLIGLLF